MACIHALWEIAFFPRPKSDAGLRIYICGRPNLATAALLVSNFGRYVFGLFRIAVSKPIIMLPHEEP